MKWASFLFILLCLSSSCFIKQENVYKYSNNKSPYSVPEKTFHIFIDKNFSETEKIFIQEAIKEWNYSLNGSIILEISSLSFDMDPDIIKDVNKNNIWLFLRVNNQCSFLPKSNNKTSKTLAWTDAIAGHKMYVVYDNIEEEKIILKEVIMHEIGHLLGSEHINDISLMHDTHNHNFYQCIDHETLEKVAIFQKINIKGLNYCLR